MVRYPTVKAGEVTIQDGTKYIDHEAFYGCNQITGALVFPDSVIEIADRALRYATMTSIDLNNVQIIGSGVCSSCAQITSLTIPNTVISIGTEAFMINILQFVNVAEDNPNYCSINGVVYNKELTDLIILPNSLSGTLFIPEKVKLDKETYLKGAQACTYIDVDENNPYYSDIDGVLYNKEQTELIRVPILFRGTVVIPAAAKIKYDWSMYDSRPVAFDVAEDNPYYSDIDGALFNKEQTKILKYNGGCSLTSYTVPMGVTTIGFEAFHLIARLQSIVLPDSVTTIEDRAIHRVYHLNNITIGSNLKSIGSSCFSDSGDDTLLEFTINYKGSEDQWNSITIADDTLENLGAATINYNYTEPATTSLLSLDTNGGSSTMTAFTTTPSMLVYGDVEHGEIVDLSDAVYIFEREGYELIGFSTNPNATEGDFFFEMPAEDTIVYAIWREIVVKDKCTCGSETEVHSEDCPLYEEHEELGSEEEEILEDEIVEDEPLIENDETVLDDSDKDEIIAPEGSITTPSVYTIKFDANGGLGSMSAQEVDGTCELDLNDFTYDGYMFVGWSLSPNGDVIYEDGDLISKLTSDIVLYAVWEANSKPEEEFVEESGEDIEEKEVSEPIEESLEEPIEELEESVVDEPIVEEPIIEEVVEEPIIEEPIIEEVVEKQEDILKEPSELPETE